MRPGRELDRLIDELVMARKPPRPDEGWPAQWIPEYSTYVASAWLVVDELQNRKFSLALETRSDGATAVFAKSPQPTGLLNSPGAQFGETGAHAICLAALAAIKAIAA